LVIGAAVLAAVAVRLRSLGPQGDFPASGHAVFLVYVLIATRRDPFLLWAATAVLAQVVVIKMAHHDYTTLGAGTILGLLLGLAARALEWRRRVPDEVAEGPPVE